MYLKYDWAKITEGKQDVIHETNDDDEVDLGALMRDSLCVEKCIGLDMAVFEFMHLVSCYIDPLNSMDYLDECFYLISLAWQENLNRLVENALHEVGNLKHFVEYIEKKER
ncbi:hypothetical protein C1645_731285 [Glomus cerebriforme]|uniref:Uncharacterized protein n=1 Tax=Glomus cerebriforme TaxID=658196 RepID=A0A397TL12_9GLOM|nr:hypothetical protein C1645_731285 [Glomus cerebriforme]